MRHFIIASHHKMAGGLKDTLEFVTQQQDNVTAICAYYKGEDLEKQIEACFQSFAENDEVIILTDMLGGSVNQKFYPYISEKVHLIAGMNLPLAIGLILYPKEKELTDKVIQDMVAEAKSYIIYVNTYKNDIENGDE